jgi:hypothetical protein
MPFQNTNKSITAFKNLLGKSQTDSLKELGNEAEGIFLNVPASSIFAETIPFNDPTTAVSLGLAVYVTATMVLDGTANGHALFATWPVTVPTGNDPKNSNLPYAYGVGSLTGIQPGDRIRNIISPSFGDLFEAKPFAGANPISVGDQRDWIFQYNSGIFFQEDGSAESWGGSAYGHPTTLKVYAYTGLTGTTALGGSPAVNIIVDAVLNSPSPAGSPLADEYTGTTGSPPLIVSYDPGVIYLTTFDTNNTNGPVRIDIDGLGLVEIKKGSETGLVSLAPDDIIATVVYYMVWDGMELQIFESAPSQAPGTYTNLNPATVGVGGIPAGTTFNNMTYTNLFNTMFYPQLLSSFTGFGISGQTQTLEVGNSIPAGIKTFVWSTSNPSFVLPNTIRIYNINTATWETALMPNDYSEAVTFASPISLGYSGSYGWSIYGVRTNNGSFAKNFYVYWYWRRFYGTSPLTSLAEADIEALSNQGLAGSTPGSFLFGTGDYKYFAWPVTFGVANFFRDSATNLAVAMAGPGEGYTNTSGNGYYFQIVSVTNSFGATVNYRVYRTRNVLGGSINIVVS